MEGYKLTFLGIDNIDDHSKPILWKFKCGCYGQPILKKTIIGTTCGNCDTGYYPEEFLKAIDEAGRKNKWSGNIG